jgi:GntR family transcriptional regulator
VVPFQVTLQPGAPAYEQVAFAARKAIVSGRLRPGEPFPSVRALSKAVKIHANTAQRVIAQLQQEGLLEVRPGIGTVVAQPPSTPRSERTRLLRGDIEQLTVEAIKLGVSLEELQRSIAEQWGRLQSQEDQK